METLSLQGSGRGLGNLSLSPPTSIGGARLGLQVRALRLGAAPGPEQGSEMAKPRHLAQDHPSLPLSTTPSSGDHKPHSAQPGGLDLGASRRWQKGFGVAFRGQVPKLWRKAWAGALHGGGRGEEGGPIRCRGGGLGGPICRDMGHNSADSSRSLNVVTQS